MKSRGEAEVSREQGARFAEKGWYIEGHWTARIVGGGREVKPIPDERPLTTDNG
jgi:hypothetical protein